MLSPKANRRPFSYLLNAGIGMGMGGIEANHMSSACYTLSWVRLTVSADTSLKVNTEHFRGAEGNRENVSQSALM